MTASSSRFDPLQLKTQHPHMQKEIKKKKDQMLSVIGCKYKKKWSKMMKVNPEMFFIAIQYVLCISISLNTAVGLSPLWNMS